MYPVSKDTSTDSFLPTVNVGENQGAGMDLRQTARHQQCNCDRSLGQMEMESQGWSRLGWLVSKALAMSQSI